MIRRAHLHTIATVTAACAGLVAPALGLASSTPTSGGSGLGPASGSTGSASSGSTASARPADATVSARGSGLTVRTRQSGLLRHVISFTGTAPARDAGRLVEIERAIGGGWARAAHATIASSGSFSVRWRASQMGHIALEAVLLPAGASADVATRAHRAGAGGTSGAPSGPATSPLTITVYRPAVATFYGPGFWGHRTACGQRLRPGTLGVASRTAPCGTRITVLYRGRTITVPVIDRGPYAHGVTWDLTEATAQALEMTGTATVGTIATR